LVELNVALGLLKRSLPEQQEQLVMMEDESTATASWLVERRMIRVYRL